MRISDWSSDVCSSDLAGQLADLKGRRAAVNAADSQSGCHALRHAAMDLADEGHFFGSVVLTGSHRASMQAVAAGEADVCAIDCVTWCLLQRSEPALTTRLRSEEHTSELQSLMRISYAVF